MKSILVACEGNICRSPMAQAVLAAALPGLQIASAGTHALSGMPADDIATQLMRERGMDITRHRATQITLAMCLRADMILVMDSRQRRYLEETYPQACGRIFRLGEFGKRDVPDPYRRGEAAFRAALGLIDEGTREWVHRIEKI